MPAAVDSVLTHFPPMGVYETLFKFLDATGKYMGRRARIRGRKASRSPRRCPADPTSPQTNFTYTDLKYPQATGEMRPLVAIRD